MALYDMTRSIRIGERDTCGFEFYGDDLPTGVMVLSGTVAVAPVTGLTLGSATALLTSGADGLYAWITGVTAGEYYVTFTATFSDTKALKRIYRVIVEDPDVSQDNILTIEEVRAFLKGDSSLDESLIAQAIEGVSARFANYIGTMSLREKTYTAQVNDGPGARYLYLPAWPITTIASLTEDSIALVENTNYYVDYDWGILERVDQNWIDERRAIVVTYDAGYDISGTVTLPAAIKYSALVETGRAIQAIQHKLWGEESRSIEGGSVTFNTAEFLPDTLATLNRFKRYRI